MSRKRFKPEEIVNKLREADVLIARGQTVAQACKRIGVTGFTYPLCRNSGLSTSERWQLIYAHNVMCVERRVDHRCPKRE